MLFIQHAWCCVSCLHFTDLCAPLQLDADEKKKVLDAVNEALEWLEDNQDAEPDEYKDKLKEVEDVTNPIIAKVYQAAGGAPGGEGPGGDDDLGDHDEL